MAQAFPVRCTNCGLRREALIPQGNVEEELRNLECEGCGQRGTFVNDGFG